MTLHAKSSSGSLPASVAGWPTSSRGRGHDDQRANINREPIIEAPPSKNVGHPP